MKRGAEHLMALDNSLQRGDEYLQVKQTCDADGTLRPIWHAWRTLLP
jgi:hypothetical protein